MTDPKGLDLRILRTFITVVDTGSLTRAAGALKVAQPALTVQIKRLEADLGVLLLNRSSTGVTPTTAGRDLYREATRLLADAEALRERVSRTPDRGEGSVRMGALTALVETVIAPFLLRMHAQRPSVQVQVGDAYQEMVLQRLLAGTMEFGLIAEPPEGVRLQWRPLAVEPITFIGLDRQNVVRPMLATVRAPDVPLTYDTYPTIRFIDAVKMPLLMFSRATWLRGTVERAADALGCRTRIVHESDSFEVMRALYVHGVGFTFANSGATSPCANDPDEVRARVIEPVMERTVGIGWLPGQRLTPAARTAIALLREEVGSAIREGRWAARHVDRDDYSFG